MARRTQTPPLSGRCNLATMARIFRCQTGLGTRNLWQRHTYPRSTVSRAAPKVYRAFPRGKLGCETVPGGLRYSAEVGDEVLFRDHPERTTILPRIREGVCVYEFFENDVRSTALAQLSLPSAFPVEAYPNRVLLQHVGCIVSEIVALRARGFLVLWE